jgi:hypothetical protein
VQRVAVRLAYRLFYVLFLLSGHPAAALAGAYRSLTLAAGRSTLASLTIVPLQIPVLACWCVVRPAALGSFVVCRRLAPATAR